MDKEYYQKWLKNNPDYHKNRQIEKHEEIAAYKKKWAEENKEHRKEYLSNWREENREDYNNYHLKYRQENREDYRKYQRKKARERILKEIEEKIINYIQEIVRLNQRKINLIDKIKREEEENAN